MKHQRMPLQTLRPMARAPGFPPHRDYTSLSVKDLLDAREAYHVYLSTLENVVATAIGRYLIHEEDWFADHAPDSPRPKGVKPITAPKTLNNTVICPWSWPAVLVFVRTWDQPGTLGSRAVPRTLYCPTAAIYVHPTPDELLLLTPGPRTAAR